MAIAALHHIDNERGLTRVFPFPPLVAVQMPSDQYEEGIVAEEMQTGFTCKGKLVRPAYVMVSAGM